MTRETDITTIGIIEKGLEKGFALDGAERIAG